MGCGGGTALIQPVPQATDRAGGSTPRYRAGAAGGCPPPVSPASTTSARPSPTRRPGSRPGSAGCAGVRGAASASPRIASPRIPRTTSHMSRGMGAVGLPAGRLDLSRRSRHSAWDNASARGDADRGALTASVNAAAGGEVAHKVRCLEGLVARLERRVDRLADELAEVQRGACQPPGDPAGAVSPYAQQQQNGDAGGRDDAAVDAFGEQAVGHSGSHRRCSQASLSAPFGHWEQKQQQRPANGGGELLTVVPILVPQMSPPPPPDIVTAEAWTAVGHEASGSAAGPGASQAPGATRCMLAMTMECSQSGNRPFGEFAAASSNGWCVQPPSPQPAAEEAPAAATAEQRAPRRLSAALGMDEMFTQQDGVQLGRQDATGTLSNPRDPSARRRGKSLADRRRRSSVKADGGICVPWLKVATENAQTQETAPGIDVYSPTHKHSKRVVAGGPAACSPPTSPPTSPTQGGLTASSSAQRAHPVQLDIGGTITCSAAGNGDSVTPSFPTVPRLMMPSSVDDTVG